jgi:hypothetical protein
MTTIYPAEYIPEISKKLLAFQAANYKDMFFVSPPAWFRMYMWMELFFHVPISLWSIGALWRGMSLVSLFIFRLLCFYNLDRGCIRICHFDLSLLLLFAHSFFFGPKSKTKAGNEE